MQYKYKTSFSSQIRCIVPDDRDKFLSKASAELLKDLIPDSVKGNKNIDLLPFVGALCNIGRANLNSDLIDKATAKEIYKQFILRPINLSHDRKKTVGVIVNSAFSTFETDKPLDISELDDLDVFNISISGVIFKIISEKLEEFLVDSSDPSNELFGQARLSWEIGFDDYKIMVGTKNIDESKIIDGEENIAKYSKFLVCEGGKGQDEDGNIISRLVCGNVYPLGAAITSSPAAKLSQIFVLDQNEDKESPQTSNSNTITSHSENLAVINNDINKNKEKPISMSLKITKIKDITDELLKECKADVIRDFIDEEITKAADKWLVERTEKDNALAEVQKKQAEAVANAEKAQKDLEIVQKQLSEIQNKVIAQEKQEKFNGWMAYFDEKYELDKEDNEILASDLKVIDSDESFAKYQKKMDILLKSKNKEILAAKLAEAASKEKELQENKEKKTQESTASTKESNGEKIESALENGEKGANLPNGTTVETSLKDKYKEAFSFENMTQTNRK